MLIIEILLSGDEIYSARNSDVDLKIKNLMGIHKCNDVMEKNRDEFYEANKLRYLFDIYGTFTKNKKSLSNYAWTTPEKSEREQDT